MSVIADFLITGATPSLVGGTGTTVKYFPRLLGANVAVQSVAPSATSAVGQLNVPGDSKLNGQWFEVYVGADITSGAADSSVTAKLSLYAQTSANLASPTYTEIATTGLLTAPLTGTSYEAGLRVLLFGTTKSGIVRGFQAGVFGANNIASANLTNNLSSISFANGVPFGLVAGVTFTNSDAANAASLYQLQVAAQ